MADRELQPVAVPSLLLGSFLQAVASSIPAYFGLAQSCGGTRVSGAVIAFCERLTKHLADVGELELRGAANEAFREYSPGITARTVGNYARLIASAYAALAAHEVAQELPNQPFLFRLRWDGNPKGSRGRVVFAVEALARKKDYGVFSTLPAAMGGGAVLHLPAPLPDFSGRDNDRERLVRALGAAPLAVEIIGPPACGKSELAMRAAHEKSLDSVFPDGRLYFEMSQMRTTGDAMRAFVAAVGRDALDAPSDSVVLQGLYREALAGKRFLLLVDNVPAGMSVRELRPPMGSTVLLTSHQPTRMVGVASIPIDTMSLADAHEFVASRLPWAKMSAADIKWLLETYPALRERLIEGDEERHWVIDVYDILAAVTDRLPGAMAVLTTSMQQLLECGQAEAEIGKQYIESLLTHPLRLRRLAAPGLPNAAFDAFQLAYDLLEPRLRKIFRGLAVFPASFTPEAAAEIVGASTTELDTLADRRLLKLVRNAGRYRYDDLLRSFAWEKLRETQEYDAAQFAHAQSIDRIAKRFWHDLVNEEFNHAAQAEMIAAKDSALSSLAWIDELRTQPAFAEMLPPTVALIALSSKWFEPLNSAALAPYVRHAMEVLERQSDVRALDTMRRHVAIPVLRDAGAVEEATRLAVAHLAYLKAEGATDKFATEVAALRRIGVLPVELTQRIALLIERFEITSYWHLDDILALVRDCVAAGDLITAQKWCDEGEVRVGQANVGRARYKADLRHARELIMLRGDIAALGGDWHHAVSYYEDFLERYTAEERAADYSEGCTDAEARAKLASLAARRGDFARSREFLRSALYAYKRRFPHQRRAMIAARMAIARAFSDLGLVRRARMVVEPLYWSIPAQHRHSYAAGNVALWRTIISLQEGDFLRAHGDVQEALRISRRIGALGTISEASAIVDALGELS